MGLVGIHDKHSYAPPMGPAPVRIMVEVDDQPYQTTVGHPKLSRWNFKVTAAFTHVQRAITGSVQGEDKVHAEHAALLCAVDFLGEVIAELITRPQNFQPFDPDWR